MVLAMIQQNFAPAVPDAERGKVVLQLTVWGQPL